MRTPVHTPLSALFIAAAMACMPAPAIAQVVNYTFSAGPETTFTNGDVLTGTMTVDFGNSTVTAANLAIGNVTSALFTQADVMNFGQYSNVVCGSNRTFYEALFMNAGNVLFLDFEQGSTTTPIPGNTGVHTSYTPNGGVNVALAATCNDYNNAPPPAPANPVLMATQNMGNTPAVGAAGAIDSSPALGALFAGSDDDISRAVTQTLPLLTGSAQLAANSALSGINRLIQARIEGHRGMSSGDGFIGDRHFWVKPFGSRADQDNRGGVAGYRADTYGLAAGVDGALSDALRIGAAVAYAQSNIGSKSTVAAQKADVDVFQLIGYGSYALNERTEINFQVDVGRNDNKGRRVMAFNNAVAQSDYTSHTAHVGVGIGRNYTLAAHTTVTPSVRIDYTWIRDKAYTETGAGLLNLDVNDRSTAALVLGAGGKLAHRMSEQLALTANLGIGYDTINERAAITAAFASAPGAAFVTYGIDPSPWTANGGIGAVYQTLSGMEVTARYDAEHRTGFLIQTASLKARWAF